MTVGDEVLAALKARIDRSRSPDFMARLERNMTEHRVLLNRLAREGDCGACRMAQQVGLAGCDRHRSDGDS